MFVDVVMMLYTSRWEYVYTFGPVCKHVYAVCLCVCVAHMPGFGPVRRKPAKP